MKTRRISAVSIQVEDYPQFQFKKLGTIRL